MQLVKFDNDELKTLLQYLAFHRIICELVIVDILRSCNKEGNFTPKKDTVVDYERTLEGERFIINLIGRKESAKIYGFMEGRRSSIKTVDYVLENDSVEHYKKLISSQK